MGGAGVPAQPPAGQGRQGGVELLEADDDVTAALVCGVPGGDLERPCACTLGPLAHRLILSGPGDRFVVRLRRRGRWAEAAHPGQMAGSWGSISSAPIPSRLTEARTSWPSPWTVSAYSAATAHDPLSGDVLVVGLDGDRDLDAGGVADEPGGHGYLPSGDGRKR